MEYQFVITKQRDLLDQYYALRELCIRTELGVEDFDGAEDDYDRNGTILVALDEDNQVVAGVRVFGSYPDRPRQLPVENTEFSLNEFFPELGLSHRPYCYWSRFVIHPDKRRSTLATDGLQQLLGCCEALGFHYAFIVTESCRTRYYRKLHNAIGREYTICDEEISPIESKFAHYQQQLSYSVLQQPTNFAYPDDHRDAFLNGPLRQWRDIGGDGVQPLSAAAPTAALMAAESA